MNEISKQKRQLEFDITGQIKEHLTTEELLEIIRAEEEAV